MRLLLLLSLALVGCGGFPRAPTVARARIFLERHGAQERADVLIVHGCPAWADGRPSSCNKRRAAAAVRAFNEGLAGHVIFTGGPTKNEVPEAWAMAEHARTLGLPDEAITLETRSRHTVTNLSESKGIMKRSGFRTAILVSEAMHLVWAKQLADFYKMKTSIYAADPLPPYSDEYLAAAEFDEMEPWKSQTRAYGSPQTNPSAVR